MSVFRRCTLSLLPFLAMFFSGCGGFKGVVTPTLSSISPASVAAGSAAFTLTVTGTNFLKTGKGTQILWDGAALTTTVVSNTQLTASITADMIKAGGTVNIGVLNPDTTTSNGTLPLTITGGTGGGSGTPPTLTSISPSSAVTGSADLPLTAVGTGFVSGSQIVWDGTVLTTTFGSSTQLTATVPAADFTTPTTVNVFVLNPDSTVSNFLPFTITASPNLVPTLTKISPNVAVAGSPDLTITLTGTNFAATATVLFGTQTTQIATTYVSSTQLTAVIPAADLTKVEQASVWVANSSTAISNALTFGVGIQVDYEQVNDLVWDSSRKLMYISVLSSTSVSPSYSLTVRAIDPNNPSVNHGVYRPAAGTPNRLAISDDGKYLYVGLDGQNAVERFTLPLGNPATPDLTITLGHATSLGTFSALEIQVAPGQNNVIAVAQGTSASSGTVQAQGGVAVFDNDVQRPNVVAPTSSLHVLIDTIQWGADATALYAANNENTGGNFYQLAVSATGVTYSANGDFPNFFSIPNSRIHYDRGNKWLYGDDGLVYDPVTATQIGDFVATGIMVPDSTIGDAYFVGQAAVNAGTSSYLVESFKANPAPLHRGSTIPLSVSGAPQHLIRWGTNGLAFNTKTLTGCVTGQCTNGSGRLYILSGPFVTTTVP